MRPTLLPASGWNWRTDVLLSSTRTLIGGVVADIMPASPRGDPAVDPLDRPRKTFGILFHAEEQCTWVSLIVDADSDLDKTTARAICIAFLGSERTRCNETPG